MRTAWAKAFIVAGAWGCSENCDIGSCGMSRCFIGEILADGRAGWSQTEKDCNRALLRSQGTVL